MVNAQSQASGPVLDPDLISGDDSARAPPLPIPNREVKPCYADGTAKAGEQVIAVLLKSHS